LDAQRIVVVGTDQVESESVVRALRWIAGILAAATATYLGGVVTSMLPPPKDVAGRIWELLGPPPDAWDPAPGARPTQDEKMHACPTGSALAAVRGANDFLCRPVTPRPKSVTTQTSRAERVVYESHACPAGFYIRGMNVEENRFLCSQHVRGAVANSTESTIQAFNPPTCPSGQVAVGFNQLQQKILCSSIDGLWRLGIWRFLPF